MTKHVQKPSGAIKHTFLSMMPVFGLVETFIPIHLGPGMHIDASKRAQRIFVGSKVL
jgi:hypothetical protein